MEPRIKRYKVTLASNDGDINPFDYHYGIKNDRINHRSEGIQEITDLSASISPPPSSPLASRISSPSSAYEFRSIANTLPSSNNGGRIHHEPVTCDTTINDLYPELLSIIFSFLDLKSKGRAAQVCSTWRDAVYNKSVWKDVEAKLRLKNRNETLLRSLVCRGIKKIQILSFEKGIKEVTVKVNSLERLILTGCYNLTDERLMTALSFHMPSLRELSLGMCKQISDVGFTEISQFLPNLERLDLGGCNKITDNSLETIRRNFKCLKHLNLRSCRFITNSGISRLCAPEPDPPLSSSHKDASLLQSSHNPSSSTRSSHSCHHNKYNFSGHLKASDDNNNNHHQKEKCSKYCQSYNCSNCADNSKKDCLTSLEQLDLHDCQTLTDDSLQSICGSLVNLKILNLSFCVGITDMGLKYISSMSQLKEINLRSCNSISDIGLKYLSESDVQLNRLDVSFCEKIGDTGLDYIAQGLQSLRDLSLNSCSITDRGLVKLSQSLTLLETLNIGQCNKITDGSIFAITDNCRKLVAIDLYGCNLVTTAGYQRILELPELKYANTDIWQDQRLSMNEYLKAINSQASKALLGDTTEGGAVCIGASALMGRRLVNGAKSSRHLACLACNYPDFAFNYYKSLFGCNDTNVIVPNCIVTTTKLCETCRNVSFMFNHHLDGSPYYILLKIDNRS
ncbi:F-box/LRR-repeat protein 14-like [Brevipalpus obovatus]|uniref:F-box/LRR-repeat protein 14-like n=1 Tax=Brevipalpus obovatus TaxID=246614 RepID=UPI003D9E84C6